MRRCSARRYDEEHRGHRDDRGLPADRPAVLGARRHPLRRLVIEEANTRRTRQVATVSAAITRSSTASCCSACRCLGELARRDSRRQLGACPTSPVSCAACCWLTGRGARRTRSDRRPEEGVCWSPATGSCAVAAAHADERTSAQQTKFRRAVLACAGGRCQWVEDGRRCEARTGLTAHHLVALVAGGIQDPSNGVLLCRPHHERAEAAGWAMPIAPSYPVACA